MIGPRDLLSGGAEAPGVDKTLIRLALFGILIVGGFVALFSRLWFLQVLAADDFRVLGKETRVRRVESEPPRGRILDRNGKVLVDNRSSLSVTIERDVLEDEATSRKVLRRLSRLLDIPVKEFRARINDGTISPYKPVALAHDISSRDVYVIEENKEDFPGVETLPLQVRTYPQGPFAAQILGYVREITEEQLETDYFKNAEPGYEPGDIVGQAGLERSYDRFLRGRPQVDRKIVNSANRVVASETVQEESAGKDLVTSLDLRIQKASEKALAAGIEAARTAGYDAPDGGAVVMDPNTGEIIAMASYPTYDPNILSDGLSNREWNEVLGNATETADDDAMFNRTIQAAVPPGSTFKVVTAGAALAYGLADISDLIDCPPTYYYGTQPFNNWSGAHYGAIGFAKSLEISCDTFYYELGVRLEERWGAANGDGSEKFQEYMRLAGFGHPTGIDLPGEGGGNVPDQEWLEDYCDAVGGSCDDTWLPGYSVNMSIGQGSLGVSPLQMAVTYAALLNGGKVLEPRVGKAIAQPDETNGDEETIRAVRSKLAANLPLEESEMAVLRQGLEDVVMGSEGTAGYPFSGFPLDRYPVAGKTGTAQIGSVDSGRNYAWFVSYAPAKDPQYLVSVYIHKAGHGGESAAPVAREIYEAIFRVDQQTDVTLSQDASG